MELSLFFLFPPVPFLASYLCCFELPFSSLFLELVE
jgi:hypothetical protein